MTEDLKKNAFATRQEHVSITNDNQFKRRLHLKNDDFIQTRGYINLIEDTFFFSDIAPYLTFFLKSKKSCIY